jgi:DNA-binding response OmpR family regulator
MTGDERAMRILVVEDEKKVGDELRRALESAGHVAELARDGEQAWFLGDTEDFDLAVLDLGLPGLDGTQVLKRWRANGRVMPVLVLTARDGWSEKVECIDAGADDYLVKPFRMEELLARVRALLRRATGHGSAALTLGDVTVDTRISRVTRAGLPVDLSPMEYRLAHYLMHHVGRAVSQIELTEHIYAQDFERNANAIEVLVARVRRKLGDDFIKTRRGFGYYVGELGEGAP